MIVRFTLKMLGQDDHLAQLNEYRENLNMALIERDHLQEELEALTGVKYEHESHVVLPPHDEGCGLGDR